MNSLIIYNERGVKTNKYKDILYDGPFFFIDDLLEPPKDPNTIQVTNENIFLFIQDNASCYKAYEVLEFLVENHVPLMECPLQSPNLNSLENL